MLYLTIRVTRIEIMSRIKHQTERCHENISIKHFKWKSENVVVVLAIPLTSQQNNKESNKTAHTFTENGCVRLNKKMI